jgi:signal transduction histidine kinase
MPRSRNASISWKLTWMNMLVSGAALLLAGAIFFAYDFFTFRQAIVQNLSTQAQMIGSNSVSALTFDDPQSAQSTLAALRATPNVVSAVIYSADGHPFASYWRDQAGELPTQPIIPPGRTESASFKESQITLTHRVVFQGAAIGAVYIQSDLEEIHARQQRFAVIVGFVLLASLIAALLVSRMSQKTISKPIVGLAEVARAVSRDRNYSVRASQAGDTGELAALVDAFNEMLAQIQERDGALQEARDELELRVQARTRELEAANGELEAFCYSVSHDLRAPLRGIDGFSLALLEDYGDQFDAVGRDYLERVRAAAHRMAALIDDLLALSRITRAELQRGPIDLSQLARSVVAELSRSEPERNVAIVIEPDLRAEGDSPLIRTVLENLIGNAWKFTSKRQDARIEVGRTQINETWTFFVRDNGAGFDQAYTDRLFGAFQRLHAATEFPGTGIGLASVLRIIHRHGGRIWAEGEVNRGATFYFSLSADPNTLIQEEEHGQQGHLVGRG